ncbi:pyridoxal phosphate-dependent decarboxylase family protein [Peijinzhouia sedimentorum]
MHNLEETKAKIEVFQQASFPLEIGQTQREDIHAKLHSYTDQFLNNLSEEKAFYQQGYENRGPIPALEVGESGIGLPNILNTYHEEVMQSGINAASGGHFGYIPGGGVFSAAIGDYLAAVTNRYAGIFYAAPGAIRLENTLINWVGKLIGYQGNFGGNLTTGGSIANLTAITAARHAHKIKGKDLEKTVIYLSEQVHHCVPKAIRISGLEECIIHHIPLDAEFRIDAEKLEELIIDDKANGLNPFMVIASAGTTDVGAVDPLAAIGQIAQEHGLWFHIDAAYGGFFMLTEHGRSVMKGIEMADSVILDPHKGLFLPYGLGMIIVKDLNKLLAAHTFEANYMQDSKDFNLEYSPADVSPELSKHFRGLRMWLPLKLHGIAPFRAALEEKLWLTRYCYQKVKEMGFEMGPYPQMSVFTFRLNASDGNNDSINKAILKGIHTDGRIFISSTQIHKQFHLRFACLSFRSHLREVDLFLEILKAELDKVLK